MVLHSYRFLKTFVILTNMLQVKNITPSDEEGTIERAIFDDNIELLQQLPADHPDEGRENEIDYYFLLSSNFRRY